VKNEPREDIFAMSAAVSTQLTSPKIKTSFPTEAWVIFFYIPSSRIDVFRTLPSCRGRELPARIEAEMRASVLKFSL